MPFHIRLLREIKFQTGILNYAVEGTRRLGASSSTQRRKLPFHEFRAGALREALDASTHLAFHFNGWYSCRVSPHINLSWHEINIKEHDRHCAPCRTMDVGPT
ncbi:hypothetical protein Peur_071370 [Populus x canadensis]